MKQTYIEISVQSSVDAGELLGILTETSCLGAIETPLGICIYWPAGKWNAGTLEALTAALRHLGDPQAEETISVTRVEDQNWNQRWAESIKPIRLGRRIFIRQSWTEAAASTEGFELVIDPKRAFGTGYHATTQLIAEWLEDVIRGGERVLDVGTGSSILAMIALRLGAREALGIDNDPEAIECAREYAAANGFGSELELRVAALEAIPAREFDLVLANLDRATLQRYFALLHKYLGPAGVLLVSGLLCEEVGEVSETLAVTGWEARGQRRREEWMALELISTLSR